MHVMCRVKGCIFELVRTAAVNAQTMKEGSESKLLVLIATFEVCLYMYIYVHGYYITSISPEVLGRPLDPLVNHTHFLRLCLLFHIVITSLYRDLGGGGVRVRSMSPPLSMNPFLSMSPP